MTEQSQYLDRRGQAQLAKILRTVPSLMEDLLNVKCGTARLSRSGLGGRRPKKLGTSLPYHLGASEAADNLHNTLTTWVRVVIDQRDLPWPANSAISCAAWLQTHMIPLALCEGSVEALNEIRDAVIGCERVIDIPPEDDVIIDEERVREANRQVVTRATVDTLAPKLGPLAEGLNERRMRTLEKRELLKSIGSDPDSGTKFYRLGDVLHAHVQHSRR